MFAILIKDVILVTDSCPQMDTRAEARERYGIRGDAYGDCFATWCCPSCSHTQLRREIELEEGSFRN